MSDLIRRKDAIEAIEEMQMPIMRSHSTVDQCVFTGIGRALEVIKDLPSAQPGRKKGRWIGYNADRLDWQRDDGSPIFIRCSECFEMVLNNCAGHWNFCPNCGADMRGENDEML